MNRQAFCARLMSAQTACLVRCLQGSRGDGKAQHALDRLNTSEQSALGIRTVRALPVFRSTTRVEGLICSGVSSNTSPTRREHHTGNKSILRHQKRKHKLKLPIKHHTRGQKITTSRPD